MRVLLVTLTDMLPLALTKVLNVELEATGISYVAHGLDARCFGRKLFNFGRAAQDLYYNFQVVKFVISEGWYRKYQICFDWSLTL